jgi:hypothetical protein
MTTFHPSFFFQRVTSFGAALVFIATLASFQPLSGQNTTTVFSPDVDKGEKELEARFAHDPDEDSLAYRLHYQYGFTESFRLRAIAAFRDNEIKRHDFRYFRLEAQYQFLEDETDGFDSAFRAELQIADGDDLPGRVRLCWTNKYDINEDWQVRGILITGHQIGPESDGGYLLGVRGQVSRKISNRLKLAIDYYGDLNNTNEVGGFDEQEHQIGPVALIQVTDSLNAHVGLLFGASEAAADNDFRVFLTQSF